MAEDREKLTSERPSLEAHMIAFREEWKGVLGTAGEALAKDLSMLIDLLLVHYGDIVEEKLTATVASWALVDSTEKIPLDRISKEGLLRLLANRDYISDGELFEMLKVRFSPPTTIKTPPTAGPGETRGG